MASNDDVVPVPRDRPPESGSERETLCGMLDFLRATMVHMIEETARHCGHMDLLRECLDGSVGE